MRFDPGLAALLDDAVVEMDADHRIIGWNPGAQRITGYPAAEVDGRSCTDDLLRAVDHTGQQLCLHGSPVASGSCDGQPRSLPLYLRHSEGHRIPVSARGRALFDPAGGRTGSVAVFSSRVVSPYAQLDRRRNHLEGCDPVTELPGRARGAALLAALLQSMEPGATLGVLGLVVPDLGLLAGRQGQVVADQAARMVGQSLVGGLRTADIPVSWADGHYLALLLGADASGLKATTNRITALVDSSWFVQFNDRIGVDVAVGGTLAAAGDSPELVIARLSLDLPGAW